MFPASACHLAHQQGLNPSTVNEFVQLLLGPADAVTCGSTVPPFAASAHRNSF